ncbi:MAG: tRNA (N(6)-L-threonylcarbamoyladenosine(37)-C(2))-methylthiotransferase [archaeon GB-1867-035]|nr:tRNA (N(6)-L-threonylcarbamoyladenosine(37)-C(2))-methylthiotransferase [Candidatus Culexmicrobium profundum]
MKLKVYIETYGCAANKADSNIMRSLLLNRGHTIADTIDNADIVILNTCTVRGETERKIVKRIRELEELRKERKFKLIISGCMVKAQPALISSITKDASLVAPQFTEEIVEVVESKEKIIKINGEHIQRKILPTYIEGLQYTVPIAEGCLGNCSYCIVKIARGKLRSFKLNQIVNAVKNAVAQGAKEIRLTAQDTAAYGCDIGTTLPELISKITEIPGDFMIRIGMMTPNNALRILDELIEVYENEKVYKFLHLPLQSGDNRILKLMNRKYSVEEFKEIVYKFRGKYPELFLATDVIVGFPTESEEAFNNTCKVIMETQPDKIHISRFSPRPHTKAAAMPQILEPIKKKRSKIMTQLSFQIGLERNMKLIGKTRRVLPLERGKYESVKARLRNYKIVVIKEPKIKLGEWVKIKITGATPIQLEGKII